MKRLAAFLLASLTLISAAEAALPPLYESISEIQSVLSDQQLGKKLHSGEAIISIQKNDLGYEIATHQNRLQVNVVYEPSERPGPARYHLQFEDPIPLSKK